jgi:hypothetical protein
MISSSRNRQFPVVVTMATCMPLAAVTILGLIYFTHGWILVAYLMTILGLVVFGLIRDSAGNSSK